MRERWRLRKLKQIRSLTYCAALLLVVSDAAVCAQESGHAAHSGEPVPREILDRPVTLRIGIGNVHEKVSTNSAEAQAFYDQGLAYLHSFVWIEAIRSFHQALRNDEKLGMAYLGLADAYVGLQDPGTARAAANSAKTLEKQMTERERTWLAIRDAEVAYAEDTSNTDLYFAYRKAVSDALKKNPNDAWLWIQRGLADESSPFTHGQAGGVDTLAYYKMALTLAPGNLAAMHYTAHTCEGMGRIQEALELTTKYAQLAPGIPHARHMHGHELLRTGRTEEAIQEFLQTKELEDTYYRTEEIPARYDWHHAHNLQLMAMAHQSLGQIKSASALFREAFATPGYRISGLQPQGVAGIFAKPRAIRRGFRSRKRNDPEPVADGAAGRPLAGRAGIALTQKDGRCQGRVARR